MKKGSRNTSATSRIRSQELRSEMSLSERVLWLHLRGDKLGFRFRRQVRVGPYFLDFYCAEVSLCVEVDGEQHLQTSSRDAARDEFLRSRNIETIRIPSLDLYDEESLRLTHWLRTLTELCTQRATR